ncbi:GspE/PulE family protein [Pseudoalteromonas sp. GB56]
MDIAEKRRPQDGKIALPQRKIDIRTSILPLNNGESVVMRFLEKGSLRLDMADLGFEPDTIAKLQADLTKTAGVILMTGPTGSGKTTTLYSFLQQLNSSNEKIITLEDPVEYELEGVNQIQVNSEIGFDFAAGLRSIVRQDPDVIMVGEIRDAETARIAMQSSLTGHLVFSTVHTNDAPSAYVRLIDLGVDEFLLNASVISMIAQRLARKLCECSQPDELAEETLSKLRNSGHILDDSLLESAKIRKAVGCPKCGNSGYKGRLALIEYLPNNVDVKTMPKDSSFTVKASEYMRSNGMRTLYQDGIVKVLKGQTTIDEVVRVAG